MAVRKNSRKAPIQDDVGRIRQVVLLMLARIQAALEAPPPKNDAEANLRIMIHEQLVGQKSSLAGALVTISELLLRLDGKAESGPAAALPAPSESDVALVEAFVQRMQKAQAHERT